MRVTVIAAVASLVLLSAPAFAKDPPPAHGEPAHAEQAHEEEGGHGDHHYYSDDDDHDGTPNWLDPKNGDEPNALYVLPGIGVHLFNLLLLLVVLYFAIRKPVGDTVRERALAIRKGLTDSATTRDDARSRYEDLEARLKAIAAEVDQLRADAQREAAAEEAKLIERAHSEAERIGKTAERNIRDEVIRARTELRREAVELAVQLAEGTLRETVHAEDQQRLAREFLASLKEDEVASA